LLDLGIEQSKNGLGTLPLNVYQLVLILFLPINEEKDKGQRNQ
jgi:hypothetical protein